MRYRLRTLLILSALLPPILAVSSLKYSARRVEQERFKTLETGWVLEIRHWYMIQPSATTPPAMAPPPEAPDEPR